MDRIHIILFFCVISSFTLLAQNYTVQGLVLDMQGEPLSDVIISYSDDNLSTSTKVDGTFSFQTPRGNISVHLEKAPFASQKLTISVDADMIIAPIKMQLESAELKGNDFIPLINLDEDSGEQDASQNISGILNASNNVFVEAAAYKFGPLRFRIRGYDSDNTAVSLNGIKMNDADNGRAYWSLWGGLNDVMRNRSTNIGLGDSFDHFGGVGGSSNIDTRAHNQRQQTRISYSLSNRTYRQRLMLTHSRQLSDGFAYSVSASRRWAEEGYTEGAFYDAWSYFLSVGKKIGDAHQVNLTAFAAPNRRGKSGAAIQYVYDLAGSNYFNSYWGYQHGEKRNSRVAHYHQPVLQLSYDYKPSIKTTWTNTLSYQFGSNGSTAIDWYNAPNPSGDYYSKLPNLIEDPTLRAKAEMAILNNPELLQIDWDGFYEANRNSFRVLEDANGVDGQDHSGNWSRYIVEDRRYDTKSFNAMTKVSQQLGELFKLQGSLSYQWYKKHNYKLVEDLLGGDYYVDINKFQTFDPENPGTIQNDLNRPNRVLSEGDNFGYDYDSNIRNTSAWLQALYEGRKIEAHLALNGGLHQYWRTGHMKNGLFPDQSEGDSEKIQFNSYGLKTGLTYKISGRQYLFANAALMSRAPYFRNIYLSPRTRDLVFDAAGNEEIISGEAGYILNSPRIKARAITYYTTFKNQMTNRSFYLDNGLTSTGTFVNFIMSGIDKQHMGLELAGEYIFDNGFSINGAAALGDYIITNRPQVSVIGDDSPEYLPELDGKTVYLKNFYVNGTPQTAYTLGLEYNSSKYWFATISLNYVDKIWMDFYPLRRTEEAVEMVERDSDTYKYIIHQDPGQGGFTLDIFGGKSWRFKDYYLYLNIGVNNILNNQSITTGGYEQYRFRTHSPYDFPTRYYYAYGANYFINLSFRL